MPAFAAPAFLLAGALAALLPVAAHLIRRRPPDRAPLPTARFLSPDPRTTVRLGRPTDRRLLALRVLFVLLLGTALARPSWVPAPRGTAELVLLDRGAAMAGAPWTAAVAHARAALLDDEDGAAGELVIFDTAAVHLPRRAVTPALFDSLAAAAPGAAPSDLAAAFRAVPAAAGALRGADSVRVHLLSALPASAWSPGLAPLRRAAWPGAVEIPDVDAPAAPDRSVAPENGETRRALVLAPAGEGTYVAAALGALGYDARIVSPDGADASDAPGVLDGAALVVALAPAPGMADALAARVRAGATLLATPAVLDGDGALLPWEPASGAAAGTGGTLWFSAEVRPDGAAGRAPGRPAPGARVLAAWEDGSPAAAARALGDGCAVFVAAELEGGELPLSAAFPLAVGRLAAGCEAMEAEAPAGRLDAGALAILRGAGLPERVAAADVAGGAAAGIPLGRWVLALALLAALAETWIAYRRGGAR